MPFIPVPKVAQVNLVHVLYGAPVENTSYWLHDTGWTQVELVDLASAVISGWTQGVMPLLDQELSFEKVRARDLSSQVALGYEQAVTPIVLGGIPAPSMPGDVAYAVKKGTAYAGRSARGRIFLGGIPRSVVTANAVSQGWRANLLNGLALWVDTVQGTLSNVTHVHVSRYTNGAPRVQGAYWTVTGFTADLEIDSQDGRKH